MLKNYLIVTLRRLTRSRGHTFLNILGLTIGMACAMLIGLYINDELSYDRHHERADRIYRVVSGHSARTSGPLAPLVLAQVPGVEQAVRIRTTVGSWLFAVDDVRFYERRVYWADQSLFDIFNVPLVQGNPATALSAPYTIIISESMARKYFGNTDPIGRVIDADNGFLNLTVTAVIEDPQEYAHFHPDFFISVATMEARIVPGSPFNIDNWLNSNFYTYFLLSPASSPDLVTQKLRERLDEHLSASDKAGIFASQLTLQPLTDIHLHSHLQHEMESNGDVTLIWMLTAVGAFILLIACINFMNLATARSATRGREIGMRKVVGALRHQLIGQFLGEAVLFSAAAFLLALVTVALVLPEFREATGHALSLPPLSIWMLIGCFGVVLVVGLLAGAYPAFVLSAFAPATIFKGRMRTGSSFLKRGLVVMQFTISIILIIGTAVVSQQLAFISNNPPGFEKENVVVIPMLWGIDFEMLFDRFTQEPGVISISDINYLPGRPAGRGRLPIFPMKRLDQPGEKALQVLKLTAWGDMATTLGLTFAAGRNLNDEQDMRWVSAGDDWFPVSTGCLLNEEAIRRMGWSSPIESIGQMVSVADDEIRVVGVIRDFHLKSLHEKIEPIVVTYGVGGLITIRLASGEPTQTLTTLRDMWMSATPHIPFTYTFLDDDIDRLYQPDQTLGRLIMVFAFLAVLTSCLGLFGLATLTTQQRTREIGIRKVLGASVTHVVFLLSREFVFLVLLATLAAWPAAYYLTSRYLQTFAYRIDLTWLPFLMAGILALIIALGTVGFQAIRAARTNPTESINHE
jgi:putative ABC transport system permease protein